MPRAGNIAFLTIFPALLAACDAPGVTRHPMPDASVEHGRAIIERLGCGSCHDIPGIAWPKGVIGPPLAGFADRALIAGRLPNRPDILTGFLVDAPSLVPGTGMPPMPITRKEARDVAAWLYAHGTG